MKNFTNAMKNPNYRKAIVSSIMVAVGVYGMVRYSGQYCANQGALVTLDLSDKFQPGFKEAFSAWLKTNY